MALTSAQTGDLTSAATAVLLVTSPRVAPGLLSWPAWHALHTHPVLTGTADHPQLPALAAADVDVEVRPGSSPREHAAAVAATAASAGGAVWLAGDQDEPFARALAELVVAGSAPGLVVEVVHGSHDLPGARLLDVVAVMDRLRSPGGCPWDARQTHRSLAGYLLEEAYEVQDAIADDDLTALREELGDVLLQVAFHARLAEELPAEEAWTVDDVAGGLVDKLVRRHPHVFADVTVSGADEVVANWDTIKAAEKGRTSVTEGVPTSQPALALADALLGRAARAGFPTRLAVPEPELTAAAAAIAAGPGDARAVGDLLLAVAVRCRELGVDPEAALRTRARALRDRLASVEQALGDRSGVVVPGEAWDRLWPPDP